MGTIPVFSIILIVVFIMAFFVLGRVVRAAASRNSDRQNAEADEGYQSNTGARQAAMLAGTGLAIGGIVSGIGGGIAATSEFLLDSAIPGVIAGVLLGRDAYYLGARKLGTVEVGV